MHLIDLYVASDEGKGVGEEHAVRWEKVGVDGVMDEVDEPDGDNEAYEDALGDNMLAVKFLACVSCFSILVYIQELSTYVKFCW